MTEIRITFGKHEQKFYGKIIRDVSALGISESDFGKFAILNLRSDFLDDPVETMNPRDIRQSLKGVKWYAGISSEEENFLVELKNKIENALRNGKNIIERREIT